MLELVLVWCFAAVLVLTPASAWLGWRIGAVDIPRDRRRMHKDSVPRSGGIAVIGAVLTSWLLLGQGAPLVLYGAAGAGALFCIGLADDICPVPAVGKLVVQLLAALSVAYGSGAVRSPLRLAFTMLWLLLLTNAHNLIDGLDGLLAGTAAIEGIGLSVVLYLTGNSNAALLPLPVAVACVGFLRYNLPPASIFLGDCGSAGIGFLLGVCSLPALASPVWELGVLAPIFLFAYPLTDLFASVLRRLVNGTSIFAADRAHFHHRICARGISQPHCMCLLWLLTAAVTACGMLLCLPSLALAASGAMLLVALLLVLLGRTAFPPLAENAEKSQRKKR